MRLLHQRRVTAICAPCVSLSEIFIIRSRDFFFFRVVGKEKLPKKAERTIHQQPRLHSCVCGSTNTLNRREREGIAGGLDDARTRHNKLKR